VLGFPPLKPLFVEGILKNSLLIILYFVSPVLYYKLVDKLSE